MCRSEYHRCAHATLTCYARGQIGHRLLFAMSHATYSGSLSLADVWLFRIAPSYAMFSRINQLQGPRPDFTRMSILALISCPILSTFISLWSKWRWERVL
ncbi:uncharacterized protein K489DRAFT_331880 [Dissoconium aciculare CBS 342.82]|uniref:Uncharacterized protein n=1 Tax=Dissoconium aciculare CBS 342.82 TaxID=1314786 RepID=A0A6J3ME47_9PEZI|nr:uncharacterized protein K489DRAFT_331880 [Dissoconium aciculare CBS 342.82]KAF1826148.1 hypothetical protein K489DRAFT_331880 [Dissoconium aciculare CBS 342.82]